MKVGEYTMNDVAVVGVKELQDERAKLFTDLAEGKIPKRVPINSGVTIEFAIQYANMNLVECQYNMELLEKAVDITSNFCMSDMIPVTSSRFPAHYQILQSKSFRMGSNGILQHPDVSGMKVEDYDYFIEKPLDCIIERVVPRLHPGLDTDDAIKRSSTFAKALRAYYDAFAQFGAINQKMKAKYGFYSYPFGSVAKAIAPFDFIADQLRGFTNIVLDIRRNPEKVAEACEAITPILIKKQTPKNPSKYGLVNFPLHMGSYLRTKDFQKLYWPTFKKTVDTLDAAGTRVGLFVEHDWTRYLDYLNEFPKGTIMRFEYGDPKLIKEKVGKKHIISGLYPITLIKNGTKDQCVDKAKELIDILAPGGNYFFDFDKSPITLDSINLDNYIAVLDYVKNNTDY